MAHQPAKVNGSALDGRVEAIADAFSRGEDQYAIAKRLEPRDSRKRRRIRRQIETIVLKDDRVARKIFERARLTLLSGLVPASVANRTSASRANRTGMAATKLLFEATAFHNPRVSHEHSGEVTIKLEIPRPKFVDAESEDLD